MSCQLLASVAPRLRRTLSLLLFLPASTAGEASRLGDDGALVCPGVVFARPSTPEASVAETSQTIGSEHERQLKWRLGGSRSRKVALTLAREQYEGETVHPEC